MVPLVDLHCHLLAGLDDGPSTDEEALEMCRIACSEGIRLSTALAHQNDLWVNTPEMIRARAGRLTEALREANIALDVFPCAEVTAFSEMESAWRNGELMSLADRGRYLLVEMPHGRFIDLRPFVHGFRRLGVRLILAHAERQSELLHDSALIEQLIGSGCLIQVNSGSVTEPKSDKDGRALKEWFARGVVHLLGSDGHSPRKRRPRMAEAYRQITRWSGEATADRVCSSNGAAVLHGLPLDAPPVRPRRAGWFFW